MSVESYKTKNEGTMSEKSIKKSADSADFFFIGNGTKRSKVPLETTGYAGGKEL